MKVGIIPCVPELPGVKHIGLNLHAAPLKVGVKEGGKYGFPFLAGNGVGIKRSVWLAFGWVQLCQ